MSEQVSEMEDNRKHHYRIANPVRFFVFILICILVIAFSAYVIVGRGNAEAAGVNTYAQVVVQDGDSRWNIVEKYNPDANIDIRNAIDDIYEINDINDGDIRPGDTIFVPVY